MPEEASFTTCLFIRSTLHAFHAPMTLDPPAPKLKVVELLWGKSSATSHFWRVWHVADLRRSKQHIRRPLWLPQPCWQPLAAPPRVQSFVSVRPSAGTPTRWLPAWMKILKNWPLAEKLFQRGPGALKGGGGTPLRLKRPSRRRCFDVDFRHTHVH